MLQDREGTDGRVRTDTSDPRAGRSGVRVAAAAVLALVLGLPAGLVAQQGPGDHDHGHDGAGGHHAGLHFTHPLIAESVSPDTKIRLDHQFLEFPDGDQENSAVLEAEYAVTRSFSIEAGIPFSYTAGEPGNLEALLKFANFAFEEAGLLLGYGVEFAFPTNGTPEGEAEEGEQPEAGLRSSRRAPAGTPADGRSSSPSSGTALPPIQLSSGGAGVGGSLGTDEWEVAPFLNVGWKGGPVKLVGWGFFGIPFNQKEQSEVSTEISWKFSGLYHLSSRVQALLELDGSGGISGEAVGEDVVNLSPGVRVRLLPDTPLVLGTSVGVPLASEQPFDVRWKTSVFWHFPR